MSETDIIKREREREGEWGGGEWMRGRYTLT